MVGCILQRTVSYIVDAYWGSTTDSFIIERSNQDKDNYLFSSMWSVINIMQVLFIFSISVLSFMTLSEEDKHFI